MMSMEKLQKLELANYGRLMADNQRVLDASHQRSARFQQYEAGDVLGLKGVEKDADENVAGADDMQISIDSPIITNHHYHGDKAQPPVAPVARPVARPVKSILGRLLPLAIGAGLLGTGLGAGVGIHLLLNALKPQPQPTSQPTVIREPGSTQVLRGRATITDTPAVVIPPQE